MKKGTLLSVTVLAMCLLFFGTQNVMAGGKAETAKDSGKITDVVAQRMQWAEDNGLNKTETVEELYEKAKQEGELNLYGNTGRFETVAAEFMKQYPGIKVSFYDLGSTEIIEKFTREYKAGIRTADVIGTTESSGSLYYEFVKTGLMHNYQPDDIFYNVIDESWLKLTPFVLEAPWWYYNTEANDDLPISSWWDVTKPEWKGKFIFETPPETLLAVATAMTKDPQIMADEYERVFGEPIQLAKDEPTAAHAWLKRVAHNNPILETSLTNLVRNVGGAPGIKNPPIGYGSSAKMRERDIQGWRLGANPAKFQTPSTALSYIVIQIANEAPHVNAAKLFSRFVCGEADHKSKGLETFLTAGSYPVFSDVTIKAPQPVFDTIIQFPADLEYIYEHNADMQDYWISVQP